MTSSTKPPVTAHISPSVDTPLHWLCDQERRLSSWRQEVLTCCPDDVATLERLDAHHRWLEQHITRLFATKGET